MSAAGRQLLSESLLLKFRDLNSSASVMFMGGLCDYAELRGAHGYAVGVARCSLLVALLTAQAE